MTHTNGDDDVALLLSSTTASRISGLLRERNGSRRSFPGITLTAASPPPISRRSAAPVLRNAQRATPPSDTIRAQLRVSETERLRLAADAAATVADRDARLATCQAALDAALAKAKDLELQRKLLFDQLKSRDAEAHVAAEANASEHARLVGDLARATAARDALSARVADLETDTVASVNEHRRAEQLLEQSLAVAETELANQQHQNLHLADQLRAHVSRIAALERSLDTAQSSLHAAKKDQLLYPRVSAQRKELLTQLSSIRASAADLAAVKHELAQARIDAARLRELEEMQLAWSAERQGVDMLRERVAALEAERAELSHHQHPVVTDSRGLNRDRSLADVTAGNLSDSLTATRAELGQVRDRLAARDAAVAAAESRSSAVTAELAAARAAAAAADEHAWRERAAAAVANAKLDAARREAEELRREVRALRDTAAAVDDDGDGGDGEEEPARKRRRTVPVPEVVDPQAAPPLAVGVEDERG